jgi:hypothetical protein
MRWVRWHRAVLRRCLNAAPVPPGFTRWHVVGTSGRTGCGYVVPTAVPTETTSTVPRWKSICTRCRREDRDGVTGQLRLFLTEENEP